MENTPVTGLDAVRMMSMATLSPGSREVFDGDPRNAICTFMYLVFVSTGVAVILLKVPGPLLHTTVAL